MNLQTQIQQQQASVQMLEALLKAKRCTTDELEKAKSRLAELKGQTNFKSIVPQEVPPEGAFNDYVPSARRQVVGDEYMRIQADLSRQADALNRKMAELSNQLQKVPPTVSCPELTRPILELKAQIEAIWDKKRYLERNHCLPDEPDESVPDAPTLPDAVGLQLAYEKRTLIDKRSKLRRKLADPKAKPGKRQEWETELAQCNLKIQEIEFKLC